MKALRVNNGKVDLAEVPKPDRENEAVVRVTTSGICNTDLEIINGYAGFSGTIGHEFVGVVERADSRSDLIGKRVVGEINAGCGTCKDCRASDSRHCPNRTVLGIVNRDGAHAEFLTLPTQNLFAVPDSVSDRDAVFVEPLAAAIGIAEQIEILPTSKVAVIGDGKLGLLCAMSLALKSDDTLLIGKHETKMAIARAAGVRASLLSDMLEQREFDVVVEASGSASGFSTALDLVRPRGTVVLKSTVHGEQVWPATRVVVDEIKVVGSRCGKFQPAIDALRDKTIDVSRMISDEFSLKDGLRALDRATEKGVLKVLLSMQ